MSILSLTKLTIIRQNIADRLKAENLCFVESNTRMNYAHIGNIMRNQQIAIVVHPAAYYVQNSDIPMNDKILTLIKDIQIEFKELTRDEDKNILVATIGDLLTK